METVYTHSSDTPLVVVGGSAAGVAAVEAAREAGYDGPAIILHAEDRPPYKRTKISKTMVDDPERDAFALHDDAWYREQRVECRTDCEVVSVDARRQVVTLGDASALPYGALVLALGAEPVLPGVAGLDTVPVHMPYTQAAVEDLTAFVKARLQQRGACAVSIIGCGITALEVADQLLQLGASVHLFGRGRRLMRGALNSDVQAHLRQRMLTAGLTLYENREVRSVGVSGDTVEVLHGLSELGSPADAHGPAVAIGPAGTRTGAGAGSRSGAGSRGASETRTTDALVVACGLIPRTIPGIAEAGLGQPGNGIPVDRTLQVVGHEGVFACGDCARHPDDRITWLWRDAKRQGAVAGENAARLLGGLSSSSTLKEYRYVPFRLKTAVFGDYYFSISAPDSEFLEDDESPATCVDRSENRYRALWVREGRVVRIVMMNDQEHADDYMAAVVEGWSPERVRGL
ncbi:MAG: NAD(P)/FAD-dependent oxidoreductase [Spirochaetaceae bacterium]|nr:MAG: NAD(P)/FAD-dependent oxidoreductase [Spirochaetaceae bacterium]